MIENASDNPNDTARGAFFSINHTVSTIFIKEYEAMKKSISLLLGAGFSAPMGYPVGNQLNNLLLGLCTEIGFKPDGSLYIPEGSANSIPKNHWERAFDEFKKSILEFYQQEKGFDYEKFYDHIVNHNNDLYLRIRIFNQLVHYFIKDENNNRYYGEQLDLGQSAAYQGIKPCILELLEEDYTMNVHTLNHDLLFEALYKGRVSDGFEEEGSPYFADLSNDNRRSICLKRYTGKYATPYRLYKLHGSIDYHYFSAVNDADDVFYAENYIKLKPDIDRNRLKKEIVNDDGNLEYQYAPPGYYHPDFLTGTTAKILRYEEPLLYKKLFDHFQENLQQAEKLIIIGYGGRDEKVNEMILERFNSQEKTSYIIDPCPGDAIKALSSCLGAKLIEKQLEDVTAEDLV